jgi:hypothetical protein
MRAEEREGLLALTNSRGLPLTWSHFELLAGVRVAAERMRVARMVIAEELSVDGLRRWLRGREIVSQS